MTKNLFGKIRFSSKGFIQHRLGAGFTLIELLIVIAILGVLAAGILVAIDPVDKINSANDSKVQNDVSNIGKAGEAFSVLQAGSFPSAVNDLQTYGELKRIPSAPGGYNPYSYNPIPFGCTTAAKDCTGVVIYGDLHSKKYNAVGFYQWKYESSTGKSCASLFVQPPAPIPNCP